MDVEILKTVAQAAGIGGVALGVLLLLFGDIIRKQIFPQLAKRDAYRLLRLISTFVFLIAAIGIGAWVWTETDSDIVLGDRISVRGGSYVGGDQVNSSVTIQGGEAADP